MKRFFSVLIAVLLLSLPFVAVSEGIMDVNLSVYSDEQLLLLKSMIEEELLSRQGVQYWFDYGLGQYIPKITLFSGKEPELKTTIINDNNHMYLTTMETEKEDFENYIEVLKLFGFTIEENRTATAFTAKNENNIKITLKYSQLIKYLNIEAFQLSK